MAVRRLMSDIDFADFIVEAEVSEIDHDRAAIDAELFGRDNISERPPGPTGFIMIPIKRRVISSAEKWTRRGRGRCGRGMA
jgi:hypothetical protein